MAHTKWKEPKHAAWLSCTWLLLSFFPYPVVHSAAAPTRYCDRTFVLMPTKDSVHNLTNHPAVLSKGGLLPSVAECFLSQ